MFVCIVFLVFLHCVVLPLRARRSSEAKLFDTESVHGSATLEDVSALIELGRQVGRPVSLSRCANLLLAFSHHCAHSARQVSSLAASNTDCKRVQTEAYMVGKKKKGSYERGKKTSSVSQTKTSKDSTKTASASKPKAAGFGGFGKPTRQPNSLLNLVPYEDPVLRRDCDKVDFPLSKDTSNLISSMLYSVEPDKLAKAGAAFAEAAGMAAPQWGEPQRIFVIRREYLPKEAKFPKVKGDFVPIINAKYRPLPEEATGEILEVEEWEGCFSVPGREAKVKRPNRVEVDFTTLDNKQYTMTLEGYSGRVFQHEADHLNGRLVDDQTAGHCVRVVELSKYEKKLDVLMSGPALPHEEYRRRHDAILNGEPD